MNGNKKGREGGGRGEEGGTEKRAERGSYRTVQTEPLLFVKSGGIRCSGLSMV